LHPGLIITEPISIIKKVCLLGDPAVGKTSLIRRYVYDVFDDGYIPTIGTKVTKKSLEFEVGSQQINLSLLIWDILGQKEFMAFHKTYFQGAEAGILVCDVTRKETIDNLNMWISTFFGSVGEVPIIFLANKVDLVKPEEFDSSTIEEICKRFHTIYLFTSAKQGNNVEDAFKNISERLIVSSL
jgi:small GTP-binding protein